MFGEEWKGGKKGKGGSQPARSDDGKGSVFDRRQPPKAVTRSPADKMMRPSAGPGRYETK